MAGKKPNEETINDWHKAWAEYVKLQRLSAQPVQDDLVYSGLLKTWIDPKTGKPITKEK